MVDLLGDGIFYVVRFENGKYYAGCFSPERETDNLQLASKYVFDWQPMKDLYLMLYLDQNPMRYDLIKVKQHFEIIE